MLSKSKSPKVFISYSWEDSEHQRWILKLATNLRQKGIDVTLDQWHADLGMRLPKFMEKSITKHDYILVVCTPIYKKKSDNRTGGVGYEGDIITGELLKKRNHRKFIPILRKGTEQQSLPIWLSGAKYIDLRTDRSLKDKLAELVSLLLGRSKLPPLPPIKPYLPVNPKGNKWVVTISSGVSFESQLLIDDVKFPIDKIEQRNKNGYYVTCLSYGEGRWNAILSKSTKPINQSVHLSKSFPYRTIESNSKKGYKITNISYGQGHWAIILSKGQRHIKQSWHLRNTFPERLISKKWNEEYAITYLNKLGGKWVLITSKGYGHSDYGYQYGPTLPKDYIMKKGQEGCCITSLKYGSGYWAVVVAKDTEYSDQSLEVTESLSQAFINKFSRDGDFITDISFGPEKLSD